MADPNTIAAKFFRVDGTLDLVSVELTGRLHQAAIMARMLRDMALHGDLATGGSSPDPEEMAALAEGLLAYIGFIDPLLDRLEQLADAERNARQAAAPPIAAAA